MRPTPAARLAQFFEVPYSYGAAEVILPHVIGNLNGLTTGNTLWSEVGSATEVIVAFGGISRKNAMSNPGGVLNHRFDDAMATIAGKETQVYSVSPIRDDSPQDFIWLPIMPSTDVPFMLALAHTILTEGLSDRNFIESHTTGFDRFEDYILGRTDGTAKTAEWAAPICGISTEDIVSLARLMARKRTMLMMSWSLQRSENGEHPYWLLITLAAMLGQIGLPGGGFGFGYGAINSVGQPALPFRLPSLPQLENPVKHAIPVARIADMLLHPGTYFRYNGKTLRYPQIKLVYWAGGNPFHHHQDLHRLREAWQRPEVIIANEIWWNANARHADIVFPCTLQFERNDIVVTKGEPTILAAPKIAECSVDAKNDYDIFSGLASRLGAYDIFTEGRSEADWLRHLYAQMVENADRMGIDLPEFDSFWTAGRVDISLPPDQPSLLKDFRDDPEARLSTPSGKIEIWSETVASFHAPCNPGHPVWIEPSEWRGAKIAESYPLQLMTNQPATKLHSQFDHSAFSRSKKIRGREPVRMHPHDAQLRQIRDGDAVRVFNDRGAFLSVAVLTENIRAGVIQIATGAWLDLDGQGQRPLEKHGNANVVTHDRGASEITQACAANSCLVEVERFDRPLPPVTCYDPPALLKRER